MEIKVPSPAAIKAMEGFNPVKKGTKTVAPNIAKTCWAPKTNFVLNLIHLCLPFFTPIFLFYKKDRETLSFV